MNGAGMSTDTIILMGVANLVADAISMGLGDYISSKAEADAVQKEYDREKWELENYPEGEYKEVIEIYETKHGVSNADATQLVGIFKRYPKLFLDTMFVEVRNLNVVSATIHLTAKTDFSASCNISTPAHASHRRSLK